MSIDIEAARNFVETHGTALDHARLHAVLDGITPDEVPEVIRTLQNQDGGIALGFEGGRPSALSSTAHVLTWLQELNLIDSPEAQRALEFIAQRQTPRGIWREDPALQAYHPPPWMDPESTAADVYTTAICASTLVVTGYDELATEQAVDWLQTQQGRDGLLSGFKAHSSWIAVPGFATLLGHETRATRRLIAGLGQLLSDEWDSTMLAWMLQSLLDGGYTRRTEVVNRAWLLLNDRQQPDGSFGAEEGGDPVQTALQALAVAQRINERSQRG